MNRWIVWFHRCRAVLWIVAGICAFVFGWQSSVVFVVVASIYANTVSDWAAAEAADDHRITDRLDEINILLQKVAHDLADLQRQSDPQAPGNDN